MACLPFLYIAALALLRIDVVQSCLSTCLLRTNHQNLYCTLRAQSSFGSSSVHKTERRKHAAVASQMTSVRQA
jgi:hypothetical protein